MEIWKDIKELDNNYQISNYGNVLSKSRKVNSSVQPCGYRMTKSKTMASQDNGKGYKQLYVKINGTKKIFYIHRLVAMYFIPNTENKKEVNHIDGNKANNNVSNLEWCTLQENRNHASEHGLLKRGINSHMSKLNDNTVIALRRLYRINPNFNRRKIAKKLGISDSVVRKVIKNKSWKHIKI